MNIHCSTLGSSLQDAISAAIQAHQPIADTGVAVAVIQNGKLGFAGGFGLRDRAAGAPVDAETCFAIGSATKAFTSMATAIFAGQFPLDVAVKQFLPDFEMQDPVATSETTLVDILCHRTGLAPHNCLWFLGPFTRSQLYYRLRYLAPAAPFRSTYIYSNLMYMVAGYLLETILGENYEDIIRTNILDPLGMSATNLSFADLISGPNHARGYENADELPLKDFANIAPAGAINSTVLDMAKWVQLFLRNGLTSNGSQLVSQSSLERMYAPIISAGPGVMYGLGWDVGSIQVPGTTQEKKLVFHTGDPVGCAAYVSFMPDDGLGVVVLTNQNCTQALVNIWPDKVATDIYDYLLNGQVTGLTKLPKRNAPGGTSMAGVATPISMPAASAAAPSNPGSYTGMYSNPGYGDFVISHTGSRLNIVYYGQSWPLQPFSDTIFAFAVQAFGTTFPVRVTFAKDGTGAIGSFTATLVTSPLLEIPFVKR
jgi:CubicO group peptidase (beta-lactamase class C family)